MNSLPQLSLSEKALMVVTETVKAVNEGAKSAIPAAVSIVPAFPLLMWKSTLQCGLPLPKQSLSSVKAALYEGKKAAPLVGAVVGVQLAIQKQIDKCLHSKLNMDPQSLWTIGLSSTLTGLIVTPGYLMLNGRTLKLTPMQALKQASLKQVAATTAREATFVGALVVDQKINPYLKAYLGNHRTIDYLAAFVSGIVGSVIGQLPDQILTVGQANAKQAFEAKLTGKQTPVAMKVTLKALLKSAPVRALGLGIFGVCYKASKSVLTTGSL